MSLPSREVAVAMLPDETKLEQSGLVGRECVDTLALATPHRFMIALGEKKFSVAFAVTYEREATRVLLSPPHNFRCQQAGELQDPSP
jgi:hypothetical protein